MTATAIIKLDDYCVKREDQNPSGSAKDRAIIAQIEQMKMLGYQKAVISSSGNAAIAAAFYCQTAGIELEIFGSENINLEKKKIIEKFGYHINLSRQPNSSAFKFAKNNDYYNLRQSSDPAARRGYGEIGIEINQQLKEVSSVLVAVGSGTTLLGISDKLKPGVKIWAVQPASYAPIAAIFDKEYETERFSSTDALGVRYIPQKHEIVEVLKKRGGGGLVISENELINSQKYLHSKGIECSSEGAMTAAAVEKAKNIGLDLGEFPLIIISGTKR